MNCFLAPTPPGVPDNPPAVDAIHQPDTNTPRWFPRAYSLIPHNKAIPRESNLSQLMADELDLTVETQPAGVSSAALYRERVNDYAKQGAIGYKVSKNNWCVLSGDGAGRGYYLKCVLRNL